MGSESELRRASWGSDCASFRGREDFLSPGLEVAGSNWRVRLL